MIRSVVGLGLYNTYADKASAPPPASYTAEVTQGPVAKEILEAEAKSLINFVAKCTRKDGLLCGWVDAKTGARDSNHLLADFGDWAPFFLEFGKPEAIDAHLRALPRHLRNGILRPSQRKFGFPVVTAFEHTDLLLGLLDCADQSSDAREMARVIIDSCERTFHIGHGMRSYYILGIGALPITSSVDGTFIELFVQAAHVLDDPHLLKRAEDLAEYFIGLPFFKEHGLFPELSGWAFGPRTRRAQTMKHNTNTVFGLLELYRANKSPRIYEALLKWLVSVPTLYTKDGYAYFAVTHTGKKWVGDKVDIVPNVGLLDALCDLAYFLKHHDALKCASDLGEKLLFLQDQKTGLVRRSPIAHETHFDAQTDLIIAWEKLAELTGEARYHDAAVRLFKAVRSHHRYNGGYVQSCDSRNGAIVSYRYTTRYNSLFLKAYLLYLNEGSIYDNEHLLQLLKDR